MEASVHDRVEPLRRVARWPLVMLLIALAAGPALAQRPDTSNWTCQRCPFRTGHAAEYSAGASYLDDDAAHFGDATGYDEEGGYLEFDAAGSLRDGDRQLRWSVEDLGLDSRALELEGGRQGRHAYSFEYRALPRRQFDTTQTVFSEANPNALKLPNDWVRAGTTAGFSTLERDLFGRDIESDRETVAVGGRFLPTDRAHVFAEYRRTRREGTNVQGAAYYTNASLLPRPFGYTTDELDVGVRLRSERSSISAAYYGSFFNDDSLRLDWENPFTSAVGAERAALARPPDSSFQQVVVSGDFRPSRYAATFTYSLATGLMEQDSALLDYTTNPVVPTAPLPRTSLDGRVDTRNIALTVSLNPHQRVRLRAAYRYDDRDNRTPVAQWERVVAETFDTGELTANTPYSFTRGELTLRADYDASSELRLSAGFDDRALDRDYQEVASQDEASGWGQLSWRPNAYVDLRARAGTAKREADDYDTSLAERLDQNPLMRKYNLAYRFREFAEVTVTASLPNKPVTASGVLRVADDSYTQSELGLLASDDRRFALDLSWSFAESASVYVSLALDRIDSDQAGSERFAAPDWRAAIADEFSSLGGGVRVGALTERLGFAIDYTSGRGTSDTEVIAASGSPGRFPSMKTQLDSWRVQFTYEIAERLQGALELRHQRFDAEDWALQDVGPATLPNVLALGARPYDYDVLLIGLAVQYSLGE